MCIGSGDSSIAQRDAGSDVCRSIDGYSNVEDGPETSFAGLFETVLDVRGTDGLLDAVTRVLVSARSPQVIAYAETTGFEVAGIRMAVIVQEMVRPVVSGVGFALIILSGPLGSSRAFMSGVLVFGLGAGALTITNLTLMMRMTDTVHAGLFLGVWGFAQAVGVGTGTLLGGVIRDIGRLLSGSSIGGYETVFVFEVILLLSAIPFLARLNLARFRESTGQVQLAEAVAQADI